MRPLFAGGERGDGHSATHRALLQDVQPDIAALQQISMNKKTLDAQHAAQQASYRANTTLLLKLDILEVFLGTQHMEIAHLLVLCFPCRPPSY